MSKPSSRHCLPLVLALGIGCPAFVGSAITPFAQARPTSDVDLQVRPSSGRLDVAITGLGLNARVVGQRNSNDRWSARLTGLPLRDEPFIPQQVLLESSEMLSVRLEPWDQDLKLIVKARFGGRVPSPTISSNGRNLIVSFAGLIPVQTSSSARLDLRAPGRVAQSVAVPPMRPRASAPPLGDMAVGTMLINNRSFVQASGPPVTLMLNNAPAKDALMSLARLGGYGFVFVGDGPAATSVEGEPEGGNDYPVTMAFKSERYDRALNSVLMASGLQGRLDGGTLLVGTAVSAKSFGPQMSKVFRLNQVDVKSAAEYLASLGASMTAVKTIKITSGESATVGATEISPKSSKTVAEIRETETYGSSTGPLLGLSGVTDQRLGTVTLVGDPALISVAQSYLKQLDLRKRQVAVKVQILNVTLKNQQSIDSSFSSRMGNTYVVSKSGKAHLNFGHLKPGDSSGTGVWTPGGYATPGSYPARTPDVPAQKVVDPLVQQQGLDSSIDPPSFVPLTDVSGQPILVPSVDPRDPQVLMPIFDEYGRPVYVPGKDPGEFRYPRDSFLAYLETVIDSSSSKILSQPTLLVQEGEAATVETVESVITSVETVVSEGVVRSNVKREDAGLSLKINVDKIDDNGFVTLSLDPSVSLPVLEGRDAQSGLNIFNIFARRLASGSVRLRDGQSLVLTGVITESDRQDVEKWPVLGDLPIIGQLFRHSNSSRDKNELVVIVTPSVLDDQQGGRFGYGYRPDTPAARQLVQLGQ